MPQHSEPYLLIIINIEVVSSNGQTLHNLYPYDTAAACDERTP